MLVILTPDDGDSREESAPAEANLSAAQLANQVVLRLREVVVQYYDGWVRSDDELAPHSTRDISLRTQVISPPSPQSTRTCTLAHMWRGVACSGLQDTNNDGACIVDIAAHMSVI